MSEFFFDYGLFLAKTLTFTAIIATVIIAVLVLAGRNQLHLRRDRLEVKRLNDKYDDIRHILSSEMLTGREKKKFIKDIKKQSKLERKARDDRRRVFVLNFDGDMKASAVTNLREEITSVLTVADREDEVFVRLTSSGGLVHSYGLASSQLARIRERNIPLTIAVDKVAASGGYMMACVGNRILAAPFAIIGSIGVIAQLPNFNRLLKKNDIDYEQFTAGQYKRTVTVFGENTDASRAKFREEIEATHDLFKDFVRHNRPTLDIEKVSTGEHWYGTQALEKGLIDELKTSDDWLFENSKDRDLYELTYTVRKPLPHRLGAFMQDTLTKLIPWQRDES